LHSLIVDTPYIRNNITNKTNHTLLKKGFLFFAPHDGQIFAFFEIGVLQFLHNVIFVFWDMIVPPSSLLNISIF